MIKIAVAAVTLTLTLVLLSSSARLAEPTPTPLSGCSGPAIVQDSTGVSRNYDLSIGSAGDCANQQVIVNPTANPVPVAIYQIGGTVVAGDPCQIQAPSFTPISITTATSTQIITGTAAKKTYICFLRLSTGVANNVAVVEGTGTNCATGIAGIIGGTTAANGINYAANGGESDGAGLASIVATATAADNVCLITSSAGPLTGHVKWVQQ